MFSSAFVILALLAFGQAATWRDPTWAVSSSGAVVRHSRRRR